MLEPPEELALALREYGIYRGDSLTLEIHRKWKTIEALMGRHLIIDRTAIQANALYPEKGPIRARISAEINSAYREILGEFWPTLDSIPMTEGAVSAELRPAVRTLKHLIMNSLSVFAYPQKPSDPEADYWTKRIEKADNLMFAYFAFFFTRHAILEPVIATIHERRNARMSRSSYDGGRRCDTGCWSLLAAAHNAGLSMRTLAELLVDQDLDRKPEGSRSKRIAREAKRLAEAKRTMDKRANSTPKAVRSVGRKPS